MGASGCVGLAPTLRGMCNRRRRATLRTRHHTRRVTFTPVIFRMSHLVIGFNVLGCVSRREANIARRRLIRFSKLSSCTIRYLLRTSLSVNAVLMGSSGFAVSGTN